MKLNFVSPNDTAAFMLSVCLGYKRVSCGHKLLVYVTLDSGAVNFYVCVLYTQVSLYLSSQALSSLLLFGHYSLNQHTIAIP